MGIRSRSVDELLLNVVYQSPQQQRIRHFIQTEMLYSFSLIEGFTTNIFIMVQWLHRTGQNQFNKRIDIRLSLQKSIPKDVDLIRRVASTHPRAVHARFSLIFFHHQTVSLVTARQYKSLLTATRQTQIDRLFKYCIWLDALVVKGLT